MRDLEFQPLIPSSLWLVLAVLALGTLIWYALRRPAGIRTGRWTSMVALMSAVILFVLALLLNPTWTHQIELPGGKPVLTILIDGSASMATPDAAGGIPRFTAATQYAADLTKNLSTDFVVHVREFDRSVKTVDVAELAATKPAGPATDIEAAIQSSNDDEQPQGHAVVLLSDGIDNSGAAARIVNSARISKSMICPIYTRTFGGDVTSYDIGLELHSSQDLAIIGQKLPLTATITHQGVTSARTVVALFENGREIDHRDVLLDPTGPSDVHFMIGHDQVGVYPYELRVTPLPGQTSLANTTASYVLRVVDQPVRALVLEGKPYWDSKFFIRTLAADPAVAVDAVTRISDSRLMWRTITHHHAKNGPDQAVETWKTVSNAREFLSSLDKLASYQIVILGRNVGSFLDDNAIANLQNWISLDGGALVCYRGSPTEQIDNRLDKLLPVAWSAAQPGRSRMALTEQGQALNWVQTDAFASDPLPRLPSVAVNESIGSTKPLAVTLTAGTMSDGTTQPAIVYYQYGTGRALVINAEGMWRWAFLPPEYQNQEQVYSTLWQSMMRWLTSGGSLGPGQLCSLRADRIRFSADESATATLLVREGKSAVPSVQLSSSSAPTRTLTPAPMGTNPGVYRVNFGQLPEGRYQARVATAKESDPSSQIIFDVRRYDQEEVDLQARPDLMQRIAEESGGAVLAASDPASQVQGNFHDMQFRTHPPQIEHTSAWDRWWLLAAALGLWGVSWAVRRSGGLI